MYEGWTVAELAQVYLYGMSERDMVHSMVKMRQNGVGDSMVERKMGTEISSHVAL